MFKKRSFYTIYGLIFVGLLALGGAAMQTAAQSMAAPRPPETLQTSEIAAADIEWERIHSGTLDGVLYDDLYWGGVTNSAPTLVDIDDDGDLDLFMHGTNRQGEAELHFYRNDGTATVPLWTHQTEHYFGQYSRPVQFADLDGDGDFDAVQAGWPWEPEGFIYYENTGSASQPEWVLRTTDMLAGRKAHGGFTLADIDDDDDFDLFFITSWEEEGEWSTGIAFYENTGSSLAAAWTFVTDTYADITGEGESWQSFGSIAFTDIDNDVDLDLFLGGNPYIIHYRNTGTANEAAWTFVTNTYGNIQYGWGASDYVLSFGDLDGNGTQDMLIGIAIGWLSSFRNTGTPANANWTLWEHGMLPMNYGGVTRPALADIDSDGNLDLFLGVGWGPGDRYLIFLRNDGTPAAPEWTYITGSFAGFQYPWLTAHPAFVDMDSDGDLDLFVGTGPFFSGEGGRLYFYENSGTPQTANFVLVTEAYLGFDNPGSQAAPAFADIDGDGDPDFFIAISSYDNQGQIHFYRNDGNATSPAWTHITDNYEGISTSAVAFADVDGDGDLDLFTDRGFYRNDGDANNPVWAPGTTPDGLAWSGGPPVLGDLLGDDGRPDLLLGGSGGVHLYRNLGDFPPRVSAVAPADGGSGLRTAVAVATFNSDMDPATLIPANIQVQGSASGAMSGELHYEAPLRQLYFIPGESFVEGETVAVTLKAAISDVDGFGLDGNGNGLSEGSPLDDYVWSFSIHERDEIVLLMQSEPNNLYWYADKTVNAMSVLDVIYDGAIEGKSFGYQPIILERLPSLDNGGATITPVTVQAGDIVVNTYDEVVTLAVGDWVRPAGCRSDDCAVQFTGAPFQMDQLAATFRLLPDLRWSDGQPLTASDSIYSYQIHRDPSTNDYWSDIFPARYQEERTASYVALDALTTHWIALPGHLSAKYQTMFWQPLPQHAWGHLTPEQLLTAPESTRAPLGWGPYVVQSWEPGVAITLTANPYYHRATQGLPIADTLVIRFEGDSALALAQVTAGEVDAALDLVESETMFSLRNLGILNAHLRLASTWEHLDFGIQPVDWYAATRPDFFADLEMRQAIAHCLDRQAMVDTIMYGYSSVSNSYIPSSHPLYPGDENLTLYPYNISTGTALLESLGWIDTDADGIRECRSCSTANAQEGDLLTFKWQSTWAPLRITYLQMARSDLAECGIDLVIENISPGELFASGPDGPVFGRHFDLASFAWVSGVEPSCSLYQSGEIPSDDNGWVGDNDTGYSNPAYDQACQNARSSLPGSAEYVSSHQQVMKILSEDLPILPLFSRLKTAVTHPRLANFRLDPTHYGPLYNVEIWSLLADGLPPVGTIQAGDGSQAHGTTALTLHIDAVDLGGGSVAQMFLRERVWDGSNWTIVAETGWIPYAATYAWTLDATPGAHYLSAYWMDDSGNVSASPARTLLNLAPDSSDLAEAEIAVYRVRVEAGEAFTANLQTLSGDTDLYVWLPDNDGAPDWYSNLDGLAVDQVVVTDTISGDYHLEVHGYAADSTYHLDLEAPQVEPSALKYGFGIAMPSNGKTIPAAPLSAEIPDTTPGQTPGGLPTTVVLTAPLLTLGPGGQTVQITAQVWDQKGADVPDGTVVTFTATLGTFASSGTPLDSVQTTAGLARVTLVTGDATGVAQIIAQAGDVQASLNIDINDVPSFTSLPVTVAMEGVLYQYIITAQDNNGDDLTLIATTLPSWLTFTDHGDGTATLFGTPSRLDVGEHLVVLNLADDAGLSVQQVFTIRVTEWFRVHLPLLMKTGP